MISFEDALKIVDFRSKLMQNAVPEGEGGMIAILGSNIELIENILNDKSEDIKVQIANDNTEGQIVCSGKNTDLEKLMIVLKSKNIKNMKLWP